MRTEYAKNMPTSEWDFKYEAESENPPYSMVIEFNGWAGNFERELIGYSMRILDEVQMNDVGHSEKERAMFWKEVFGRDMPIEYEDEYILKDKYLYERWEDVDDWMQATFYNVFGYGFDPVSKETTSCMKVYLFEPIKPAWFEQLIVNRMYDFFDKKIYKYLKDGNKITSMYLTNDKGEIIKHYSRPDFHFDVDPDVLAGFYKAEERKKTKFQEKEDEFVEAMNEGIKELTEILKELNVLLGDKE